MDKKIDELIEKFKEVKEELNKNVNASYSGAPNMAMSSKEKLSLMKNGQWKLNKGKCPACGKDPCACEDCAEKADKGPENPHMGHSAFTMDHVREVSGMKDHGAAKAHAHKIVDASTANAGNKAKLKSMIDRSKHVGHLAQGMTNHILAHPSENLKVSRG